MKTKELIKIVVVEDDLYYNKALVKYLHSVCSDTSYPDYKFEITSYPNAHECIENMEDDVDIMVLDYFLFNEGEDELLTAEDIIDELKDSNPECKVIVVSAQENPQVAAYLMKKGVYEYVDKNVNSRNRIGAVIQNMLNDWHDNRNVA